MTYVKLISLLSPCKNKYNDCVFDAAKINFLIVCFLRYFLSELGTWTYNTRHMLLMAGPNLFYTSTKYHATFSVSEKKKKKKKQSTLGLSFFSMRAFFVLAK